MAIPGDESDWEVVIAQDFNAPLTTYMTCSGVTPREIAMLPDGTVIASYRDSREGSEEMYRLKPDVLLRCVHEVRYTTGASAASVATDFALSRTAPRSHSCRGTRSTSTLDLGQREFRGGISSSRRCPETRRCRFRLNPCSRTTMDRGRCGALVHPLRWDRYRHGRCCELGSGRQPRRGFGAGHRERRRGPLVCVHVR